MKKFKLAIIGCGKIANFHAKAFLKSGFLITHCASSINSKSIKNFGEKFQVKNVYKDPTDLLKAHKEWDAILISVPIEKNAIYLNKIIKLNKVCLVEKPLSFNLDYLKKISKNKNELIRVAYNRRFYPTIQNALNFIKRKKKVFLRLDLPEVVKKKNNFYLVKANSAHGIDLINYLFNDLKIIDIIKFPYSNGRKVIFKSKEGSIIDLTMNWNSPANFLMQIEGSGERLELKPFETSVLYQGMKVIEPSKDFPLRSYFPKEKLILNSFNKKNIDIKPGFFEQAMEIKQMLKGKKPKISASVRDALIVQDLISKIL